MFLRPYQQKAENDIFNGWKAGHKNIFFQLVTGGGKTVLFVDIIKKFLLANKRTILIAHREELIAQAWEKLHQNKIHSGIIKADVTPNYSLPSQVASIQTLARRSKLPPAHAVIIDESHHSENDNTYGRALVDHFPNSYVLGVSATPYRLSGRGFTDLYDKLIQGPSFKELVSMGYLTSLRYFVASRPDLSRLKISKGDYEIEAAAEVMKLAPLVESYFEHCAGMCGVVFAVNIKHSLEIVKQYNAAGVTCVHLDANTPGPERREILKKFKLGIIRVISNVGIITEGFDFPDMQFVQLARPTKSLALFLQMIGRVTRTDYEAIRHATNDAERRIAVELSKKPFGYVLDNANLWEEHGMPDQNFNWERYFHGTRKGDKRKPDEFIEMEFVAEDSLGGTVRSKFPKEIEGMKLIEVNKVIREQIVNISSLKEFDRMVSMFSRMPKLGKKAGFAAYKSYREYCRKNSFAMADQVWDYVIKKLSEEPDIIESKAASERDQNIATAAAMYPDNPEEVKKMTKIYEDTFQRRIELSQKIKVPSGYLKRERIEYYKTLAVSDQSAIIKV